MEKSAATAPSTVARNEIFVGEALTPENTGFSAQDMAQGKPGLPESFAWNGRRIVIAKVLEEWKETGSCRHGSGERYVRKHWFRIQTPEQAEFRIYFERQARSRSASRWRLFSMRQAIEGAKRDPAAT